MQLPFAPGCHTFEALGKAIGLPFSLSMFVKLLFHSVTFFASINYPIEDYFSYPIPRADILAYTLYPSVF